MAIIGLLKEVTLNGRTAYEGHIRTLDYQLSIKLIENPYKTGDNMPDYKVFAKGHSGQEIEIGSAWKNKSSVKMIGDEKIEYLSISIDDPSMPQPLNVAAFPSNESGTWNVVWSRTKVKKSENAA